MPKRKLVLRRVEELTPRDDAEFDEPTVQLLAESIPLEGLREPLVITAGGGVIHGMHRLEAAKRAGVAQVECVIEPDIRGKLAFAKREAQVIAENMVRYAPTKAERDAGLARLVALRSNGSLSAPCGKTPPQPREKPSGGRPASPARAAIRTVAAQQKVSEDTVERAVKKHAPEVMAPRRPPRKTASAKKPTPKQPDAPGMTAARRKVWALFERSFGASAKALAEAERALAAVTKHDFGDGRQFQEAFRLREEIGLFRRRVAAWIPHALCPWCGGVDEEKVWVCRACLGAGVLGKDRYEKSKRSGV